MLNERSKVKILIPTIFALALFMLSVVAFVPTVEATSSPYTSLTLSAGGSTLIAPQMADWALGFQALTGNVVSVNYQAVGSTTGTDDFLNQIFTIGFSDAPVPANGLATLYANGSVSSPTNSPPGLGGNDQLIQIIDGLAPVSIFYNLGTPSHATYPTIPVPWRPTLNLTGTIIEQIYLKQLTSWNASAILAVNPGLTQAESDYLGTLTVQPTHRSDGSGTSFALTTYFGTQPDSLGNWTAEGYIAGSTSNSNFPAGELTGKGTGGVAAEVASVTGAIGYGETSYAIGAGLLYAAVENQAGYFVLPLPAGASAAAAADASLLSSNPLASITNAPGATSYPISTFTYAYVWQNQDVGTSGGATWTAGDAFDAVQFLDYIVTQGQSYAQALYYAPLPTSVVDLDLGLIAQVQYNGSPITGAATGSLTCTSSSLIVGNRITCHDTLTGSNAPTKIYTSHVVWTTNGTGTFTVPSCKVPKSGKCTSAFVSGQASSAVSVTAIYEGNTTSYVSTTVVVHQKSSTESLTCRPATEDVGASAITCIVSIIGYHPSGTITFSVFAGPGSVTFSDATCTLVPATATKSSCSVTVTGETVGHTTIEAQYSGDVNNVAPAAKTKVLNIKS